MKLHVIILYCRIGEELYIGILWYSRLTTLCQLFLSFRYSDSRTSLFLLQTLKRIKFYIYPQSQRFYHHTNYKNMYIIYYIIFMYTVLTLDF